MLDFSNLDAKLASLYESNEEKGEEDLPQVTFQIVKSNGDSDMFEVSVSDGLVTADLRSRVDQVLPDILRSEEISCHPHSPQEMLQEVIETGIVPVYLLWGSYVGADKWTEGVCKDFYGGWGAFCNGVRGGIHGLLQSSIPGHITPERCPNGLQVIVLGVSTGEKANALLEELYACGDIQSIDNLIMVDGSSLMLKGNLRKVMYGGETYRGQQIPNIDQITLCVSPFGLLSEDTIARIPQVNTTRFVSLLGASSGSAENLDVLGKLTAPGDYAICSCQTLNPRDGFQIRQALTLLSDDKMKSFAARGFKYLLYDLLGVDRGAPISQVLERDNVRVALMGKKIGLGLSIPDSQRTINIDGREYILPPSIELFSIPLSNEQTMSKALESRNMSVLQVQDSHVENVFGLGHLAFFVQKKG